MSAYPNKRRVTEGDYRSLTNYGRGRERNFGSRIRNDRDGGDRNRHDDRGTTARFDRHDSGNRGGRGGGFRGGRGGCRPYSGDQNGFHKTAGGDLQRMPDSVENKQLVRQQMATGTEGTPVELVGNFYKFLHSNIKVFHYDVDITKARMPRPSQDSQSSSSGADGGDAKRHVSPDDKFDKELCDEKAESQERFIKKFADKIMQDCVASNKDIFRFVPFVFDGFKNVYTTKPLTDARDFILTVPVAIDGRSSTFKLSFKLSDEVYLNEAVEYYNGTSSKPISERIISVFEIIFRAVIGKSYVPYQRKFFDLQQSEQSPKTKLVDFVQGFINSVRMTEFGLALNVHLKTSCTIAKSFAKLEQLVGVILNISERDIGHLNRQQLFSVNKMIRHLKVVTKHSNRSVTYTVDSLVDKYPKDATFTHKDKKMSIEDYFKTEYNIRLQSFPLVKCSGKKNVHLPLELCHLHESQFLNKNKFDNNIERELLFKSTHQPNVYFHKTANIVKRIQAADSDGLLNKFGLDLIPKAARFEGRVLPKTICANQRDKLHHTSSKPPEWVLFVLDDRQFNKDHLRNFARQLMAKANELGLCMPEPSSVDCVRIRSFDDIVNVFYNVAKKTNAELVFVGIPTRHDAMPSSDMYGIVKHCCDQKFGIMSQCFNADKLTRIPNGYFDTFLLKVNGKIGGQNSALHSTELSSLPFDPKWTMLVGVDVNHPGETERVFSSVAAAVGSYDDMFSRYNASIRVQMKERDEMVKQLEEMMAELLAEYNRKNGSYPKNVIVFRDGVSEGQFDKIVQTEIPLIVRSFKRTGKEIKLTMIVVQKRHHTRFALAQQNTSGRKPTYNVPSGTVVDKAIVDPRLKMFYLNSHFSPLGTSKPTKYVILRDDLNMSPNAIQKMCFLACFNCIRTRNVISIPTPVRYADLCAYRSKMHIEAQRALDDSRSDASQRSGTDYEDAIIKTLNDKAKLHDRIKHRLFYC